MQDDKLKSVGYKYVAHVRFICCRDNAVEEYSSVGDLGTITGSYPFIRHLAVDLVSGNRVREKIGRL